MSEQYRQEKEKYRLEECCESCNHYCSVRNKCAVLYPVNPHLEKTFEEAKDNDRIYFCKMFEEK